MGNSISWIWTKLFGVRKKRVLMVGLDNAGKTTLLYRLKTGKVVETSPTNCFNLETFEHGDDIIEVWDIGGRWTIRTHFYPNTDGLIFVLDGADKSRIDEANLSLLQTEDVRLTGTPLLILLNKVDKFSSSVDESKPESMNNESAVQKNNIDFAGIRTIKPDILMRVQPCSAITGEGLSQGMDWICNTMNRNLTGTIETRKTPNEV
ncbi:ADP-ribosylation factor 4 isoform X2 [Folsomia candida]|uniref:ADP-ribosylation factor 4 isoform X2 n=1 Tax=Folsomia candida TaxID=158441 RepID=UPI001605094D|nr:ADP-ribosylation factor 4 isoform X2 [Folsomia candida]